MNKLTAAQETILDPATIRKRTREIYDLAMKGGTHFKVDLSKLDSVVDLVLEITRRNYPDGKVPVHGRYEHLRAGGIDRVARIRKKLSGSTAVDEAKSLTDLVVLSVLLDAGAGPSWSFTDEGKNYSRSEGLAVASYVMFEAGAFSDDPKKPFQATAKGLKKLTVDQLKKGFHASPKNPMEGLEGRLGLLNRLGDSMEAFPDLFQDAGSIRPGNLVATLSKNAKSGTIEAKEILKSLLVGFSKMWPARSEVDGLALGDTWKHPDVKDLVPFHKLSQWLTYSLLEPIETAGLRVTGVEKLTGLPEYRNGGLFLDLGVLALKNPKLAGERLQASHPAIIEWRALTVQLLDEVGNRTRKKMGKTEAELPLACVLQGGTWSAGRETAKKLRPGGGPPLTLESDGTVF